MSLADAGRPEKQDVIAAVHVAPACEFAQQLDIDRRLELEVEALQRFLKWEARHRGFNRLENHRRIADRRAGRGVLVAVHLAVDDHELRQLIREIDRKGDDHRTGGHGWSDL